MRALCDPAILKQPRALVVLAVVIALTITATLWFKHRNAELDKAAQLIRAGKAAAAIPILEQLSRKHPDDSTVYPWLAQGYLITDRVAEGRTALDTALKLKQSCADLLPVVLAYGCYYEDRNDFEETRKLFDSASAVCRGNELTRALSAMYLKWAKYEFDQSNIERSSKLLKTAMQYGTGVEEPERSRMLHEIAQLYRYMSAIVEIKEGDRQALKLLSLSLKASDEPATRKAMAEMFIRLGNVDAAIENYAAISRIDENNLEARHKLIDLLVQKKDYAAAREALLELTDREKSVENCELLANLNLKMQNFAGAVHAVQDALSLKPNDLQLLNELSDVLKTWSAKLRAQGKTDEAVSVEGHQERIAELITDLAGKQAQQNMQPDQETAWNPSNPPIGLTSSHVWLAPGSLTPEGQIKIKNICGKLINDLSLTVLFYDHTARSPVGTVVVPVAASTSTPLLAGETRLLYFSCPNIVQGDHRLAVKLYWRDHFLNEFPVVKSDDLP